MYPNWFAYYQANFENQLTIYRNQPDLRFLQLGAYTGDCSLWLLENILTDPSSTLTDVDTWQGSEESAHKTLDFTDIHTYYRNRTASYRNLQAHQSTTIEFFLNHPDHTYDFIYIDADHTATAVAADAVLSWRALKPGGILAFDDYLWRERTDRHYLHPRPAIDAFLESHEGQYQTLENNAQYWIQKNKKEAAR